MLLLLMLVLVVAAGCMLVQEVHPAIMLVMCGARMGQAAKHII
jgi:hypothetical protein